MIFGKKVITWSKIGDLNGKNLYLCDTILGYSKFGEKQEYAISIVRDMCRDLYTECFSEEERKGMIPHPEIQDSVFLLSDVEYIKYSDAIQPVKSRWWLRSPSCLAADFASYVDNPDGLYYARVSTRTFGLRPAIILKRSFNNE